MASAGTLVVYGQGVGTGATYVGANATASPSFSLDAGVYSFLAYGTFSSTNAGLSILGMDGSTYTPCFTALTAAGVQAPLYLPAGTYQFTGTSTSFSASVARVLK